MRNRFEFDSKFLESTRVVASRTLKVSAFLSGLLAIQFLISQFFSFSILPPILGFKIPVAISIVFLVRSSLINTNIKGFGKIRRTFEIFLLSLIAYFAGFFLLNHFERYSELSESFNVPLSSASCILLLSVSELLRFIRGPQDAKIYQFFNLISLSITICALFGFMFGQDSIQRIDFFNRMTFSAVINLMCCSFFMPLTEPQAGWMPILTANNLGSQLLRKALVFCLPIIALITFLVNMGTASGLYDYHFAFDLIVVNSFIVFGIALFAITIHLNTVDRSNHLAIEVIRNRENDLFKAQSLAKVGSWVRNLKNGSATWSPQMYEIFGIDANKEIRPEMIEEHILPDDLLLIRSQMKDCLDESKALDLRHKVIRKDGTERFVHGRAKMNVNKITGDVEIHGTVHDITESERVLAQLLSAEKLYNDLYNEAPDMLLSVEIKTGKIIKCNRTLLNVLGYESEEVIGAYLGMLYCPDSRLGLQTRLKQFAESGQSQNAEIKILTKDGREIDISSNSSSVRNEHGEVVSTRSIWRDISDAKKARELSIKERAAAEGVRIKSNFVATMSHEIRTPLNGVIGMSEILMATDLLADQRDYVETIKQSADTLLALVNDILDFSKIESGKVELSKIDFSLKSLFLDIERQMSWSASRKGLNLRFDLSAIPYSVFYGDRNRLRQILVNLISNAIKFTSRGGVEIKVSSSIEKNETANLVFEVVDTGIGLYPEEAKRLFQPFSQTDSSISRVYGGTGLGLSISQSLARLMGAEIKVQSEPGIGSKFYFEVALPMRGGHVEDSSRDVLQTLRENFNHHILVAEDVEVNRKVIGLMLSELGCTFKFAENGAAALKFIQEENFDLVLMDCQMPILDGFESTRMIRSNINSKIASIKIIALTANATPEDRKKCLDAKMSDYLSKPITLDGLHKMLQKWLSPDSANLSRSERRKKHPMNSNIDAIDFEILNELGNLNSEKPYEIIGEILQIFELKLPKRLSAVRDSIQSKDTNGVVTHVHALKSSGSTVGAGKLAQLCDVITQLAKDGDFETANENFNKLAGVCDEVSIQLERWLQTRVS